MSQTIVPVYVVLPPRTLLLDVAGPIEVLRRANAEQAQVRFEVRYVGPAAEIPSSIGLCLSGIAPLPGDLPEAAMIVISGATETGPPTPDAPEITERQVATLNGEIVAWLKTHIQPQHHLVCICSGALLAAEAGLLKGRACTTHHLHCGDLARLSPSAKVLENRLYVEDGRVATSAGVTAGIDLMLHLVATRTSPAVAVAVARHLVVYLRRSGADPQASPWLEGRNHLHPAVHRAQDAIAADPVRAWTYAELARLAGASPRHLSRLFAEHAGMGLPDYVNRLRVTLASELLRQTRLDMERVAEAAGFASARQLRRVWSRHYPNPPRDTRAAASG